MRGQTALVEAVKIVANLASARSTFTLPQNPLAQAFVAGWKVVGDVLSIPFDGEDRIEAKGFGDERLRLVHLAQERIGSGEVGINPVGVIAGVERLSVFDGRGFGTAGADFYVAEFCAKKAHERIARAQPNPLLQIGFGFVGAAQGYFWPRSGEVEIRIIWIDGEAGVSGADRFVKTARIAQVQALKQVRLVVTRGEGDRAVRLDRKSVV